MIHLKNEMCSGSPLFKIFTDLDANYQTLPKVKMAKGNSIKSKLGVQYLCALTNMGPSDLPAMMPLRWMQHLVYLV
uniref:Uncharacterized protein n=1 Tax=Arundo donax TaxID=35708 RepID=A0A0A9FLC2_ARUDO